MTGEALARRLLSLDAAYCAAAALVAIAASRPLAALLGVPTLLLVALGAATAVWSVLLLGLSRRPRWRTPLAIVAGANAVAAAAVGGVAVLVPRLAAQLLLAAVACEVAGFAAAQLHALRR